MRLKLFIKKSIKKLYIDYYVKLIIAFVRSLILRLFWNVDASLEMDNTSVSDIPIDILIPVIDKDVETLPFVIDSARANIKHPIKEIYVVSPAGSVKVREVAREKSCIWIDEAPLLPITKKDIPYINNGNDRSGWMYQQLIKWCGDQFTTQEYYLILDSDTVFIRPQIFLFDGKVVFDYCDEYHKPYFEAITRLLGIKKSCPVSFTSHHSMIKKSALSDLKLALQKKSDLPWYNAIIGEIDSMQKSTISDYDTYAHFFYKEHKAEMKIRYWYNRSVERERTKDLGMLKKKYANRYSTLSLHSWNTKA